MSAYALQIAIYEALFANDGVMELVAGVYDNPGQELKPESDVDFPYITIGDDTIDPWDNDTSTGIEARATIHVWSRANHRLECKRIQGAVYDALHRQEFEIDGFHFVGCDMVTQDAQRDEDGLTIHGVQTFRIIYERI